MTHVPASSHTVFNGGMITTPLIIHVADPTVIPFEIRASWNAITTSFLRVSNTDNDGDLVVIDSSSNLVKTRHSNGAEVASLSDGGAITTGPSSALGLYGAAGVAQQTLHSGTATPEQIALALEAATLMTGN